MGKNSESVAEAAIRRLLEAGLIAGERAKSLETRLASGGLREEDWQLELEWPFEGGQEK